MSDSFDIENASNEWLDLYIQLALDGRRENVIPALDGVCVVRERKHRCCDERTIQKSECPACTDYAADNTARELDQQFSSRQRPNTRNKRYGYQEDQNSKKSAYFQKVCEPITSGAIDYQT
jgi:hypothetical protein